MLFEVGRKPLSDVESSIVGHEHQRQPAVHTAGTFQHLDDIQAAGGRTGRCFENLATCTVDEDLALHRTSTGESSQVGSIQGPDRTGGKSHHGRAMLLTLMPQASSVISLEILERLTDQSSRDIAFEKVVDADFSGREAEPLQSLLAARLGALPRRLGMRRAANAGAGRPSTRSQLFRVRTETLSAWATIARSPLRFAFRRRNSTTCSLTSIGW